MRIQGIQCTGLSLFSYVTVHVNSPLEEDITEDADSSDLEEDGEVIDEEIDCDHMGKYESMTCM